MTFLEMFDLIKEKSLKVKEDKLKVGTAVQINVTDEDCGGIFYASTMNGALEVEPYDYLDFTAKLTAEYKYVEKLFDGKFNVARYLKDGKIAIVGNADDVKALEKAFEEPKTKVAVKNAVKKAKAVKAKAEPKVKAAIEKAEPKVKSAIDKIEPTVKSAIEKIEPVIKSAVDKAEPTVKSAVTKVKNATKKK